MKTRYLLGYTPSKALTHIDSQLDLPTLWYFTI